MPARDLEAGEAETGHAESAEPSPGRPHPLTRVGGAAGGVILLVAPALIVAGLFLSLYTSHHLRIPVGSDTTQYMWRSKLVQAQGLSALKQPVPSPNQSQPDRPGFPILAGLAKATTGATPFDLAYVFPALLAMVIALAAGALAMEGMREPAWAFPVYAVVVGASVNVAITGNGYFDNLLVDGVLLCAAVAVLMSADGRPAMAAAIFLLVAAVSIHWVFVILFAVLIAALAVLLVPESVRVIRSNAPLARVPSLRLVAIVAVAIPLGFIAAFLAPARRGPPSKLRLSGQLRKLGAQLPYYKIPWVAPIAAASVAAGVVPPRPPRIRALLFFGMWALTPLPLVYLLHHGHSVPAQRILGFDFGVVVLAVMAFVGAARFLSGKLRWPGRVVGTVLVLAAMAGGAFLAHRAWFTRQPTSTPQGLASLVEAGEYIASTPPGEKVVFIVRRPIAQFPQISSFRRLRAFAPDDRVGDVFVYLGSPEDALAARPQQPGVWNVLGPVMRSRPILVMLRQYNDDFAQFARDHPSWQVGPDLLVVRGPHPAQPLTVPKLQLPPSTGRLYGRTAALLALLFVAGSGWSTALIPAGWLARAGVAPGFGIAALVLTGLVADRLGFRLVGGSGVGIAVVATAAGWIVALARGGRWRKALPGRSGAVALAGPDQAED